MTIKQLNARYERLTKSITTLSQEREDVLTQLVTACPHPEKSVRQCNDRKAHSYFMGQVCTQCGLAERDVILPFKYLPDKYTNNYPRISRSEYSQLARRQVTARTDILGRSET